MNSVYNMFFFPTAMIDPLLTNLKNIAINGGERGRFYDLGVLSVIEQIETLGHFIQSNTAAMLHGLPATMQAQVLTPEEIETALGEVAKLNMTIEQASQYCGGVLHAESVLGYFAEKQQK